MKKLIVIVSALSLMLLVMAGCGQASGPGSSKTNFPGSGGTPLSELVSKEQAEALDENAAVQPIAVACVEFKVSGIDEGLNYDLEAIKGLRDYLKSVYVGGKSDLMYVDADTFYIFYYEDGREVSFYFMPDQVEVNGEFYLITKEDKLNVDFPDDFETADVADPTEEEAE